jgi:hypothetical protein
MATQRATIKSLAEILFRHPSLRGRQAALRIEEDAVDLLIDETNLPQRSLRYLARNGMGDTSINVKIHLLVCKIFVSF